MKRLFVLLMLLGVLYNSYCQFKEITIPEKLLNYSEPFVSKPVNPLGYSTSNPVIGQKYDEAIVGETIYDLQGYNSLQQRIYNYPDGTIGMTWMMGFENGSWTDRGSGYNYYDGQQWLSYPTSRVEGTFAGWPCYAPLGATGELIVSFHYENSSWNLILNKRDQKGMGDWEESYIYGPDDFGLAFPAMITNGENKSNIHLLTVVLGGDYLGQDAALLYYRSQDAGQTWDIVEHYFEELGPTYLTKVNGDIYSWAAPRGDTLAFSVGFTTEDGYVMKSYDNGDTWQKIEVYNSPYSPYPGGPTPVFGAGDFTSSVALDSQGKAHVTFGRLKYYYNNQGVNYYIPGTEGIVYWNEDMPPLDSTSISSYTLDILINKGNLIGWIPPFNGDSTVIGWGNYYVSLTSYPQINIDDQDRIFVLYSGIAAGYHNGTKNFRHIFGNSSNDGGLTWNGIKDFNTDLVYNVAECMYSPLSPNFNDNKIHFFFQKDDSPGIHIWTNEHSAATNNMIYMPVDIPVLTGTNEIKNTQNESDFQVMVYPNPSNGQINLGLHLNNTDVFTFFLSDLNGKTILHKELGVLDRGENQFELNLSNLKPGIYFYQLIGSHSQAKGKFIISD